MTCVRRTLKLRMSRLHGSIQQPVVECLVAEGDAAELFATVDVPGADAHPDLLGPRVFLEALTHSQQHSGRGCRGEENTTTEGYGRGNGGEKGNKTQMGHKNLIKPAKPMGQHPHKTEEEQQNVLKHEA